MQHYNPVTKASYTLSKAKPIKQRYDFNSNFSKRKRNKLLQRRQIGSISNFEPLEKEGLEYEMPISKHQEKQEEMSRAR